ncbi:phosphotransferase enzyme family protein [Gayadomonas joobiniege]|uniref:phosphotransferase enzyme family protein n=1 Tax=Gayadomonas joobiniege TaxID=1234606 RepID=UPI0003695767|nr:phosphotransferase [Gayadomonas joobiniege]
MYSEKFIKELQLALAHIAANWHLAEVKNVELLTVSENATFKVTYQDNNQLAFRISREGYNSQNALLSELDWIRALISENTLYTAAPIADKNGQLIGTLTLTNKSLTVIAFKFLAGAEPTINDDIEPWFERLGGLTAKLHQHSQSWQPPKYFERKIWNYDTMIGPQGHWGDWQADKSLKNNELKIIKQALSVAKTMLNCYTNKQNYGLIHADLRLSNLLVLDDQIAVIDFDDCGYCWYMYDFAATISFYELENNVEQLKQAWLKGYQNIRPLNQADIKAIDTFIFLRRVLLTAWLAGHPETPTASEFSQGFASGTALLAERYLNQHKTLGLEHNYVA